MCIFKQLILLKEKKEGEYKGLSIMKLLTLFLMIFTLQVMATGYAEAISADLKNPALNEKPIVIEHNDVLQALTVTGNVVDTNGDPLPGVSISIKGTLQGTATDANGAFTLQVPNESATLVFSYIGFNRQEVVVGNRRTIDITLKEDTQQMEEVVVIGYGSIKKSNLTSSVSKIGEEALALRPVASISDALAGQLAGVHAQEVNAIPGTELQIRVRGMNSINGNNNPIYVIDGVARENMSTLNPSDIASIQVLKDASASAIYGARGANGVILIETKRGTGKPTVTLDAYYGIQSPVSFFEEMMTLEELRAYYTYNANVQYLRSSETANMSTPMSERPAQYQMPDFWYDPYRIANQVDYIKEVVRDAPIQNYQLSASGSNNLGNIYVSGGYFNQEGIMINSYYRRFNFRVNGMLNLNDRVRVGLNIAPSFSTQSGESDAGSSGNNMLYTILANPLMLLHENTMSGGWVPGITTYPNPYQRAKQMKRETSVKRISNVAWGEIDIMKDLTFRSQFSYNFDGSVFEYFLPADVQYNAATAGNSNSSSNTSWEIQNTLTYSRIFNKHDFNVVLGQSTEAYDAYSISATKTGWPTEEISTLNVATTPTAASTNRSRRTGASIFGRISYSYMDKYLLTATVRRDGSSRFGANNKWGTFPALSAGWKINEESFLKDIAWMNLLKIRAAWGKSGNDRSLGNYDYMPVTSTANTVWNGAVVPGYVPGRMRNDNLQWESNNTFDVGFDISTFKNRLQLNIDYYVNTTDNLLFSVPIPSTSGFDSFTSNMGKVENRGWEIDINSYNLTGEFKWSTSINLSRNRNKVLSMGADNSPITTSVNEVQLRTVVGGPICQFLVYRTDGLLTAKDFDANGNPLVPVWTGQEVGHVKYVDQPSLDENGNRTLPPDGVIDTDDMVLWGNNLPDLIYGITNRFSYKGLELSILLQGQFGGYINFIGMRSYDNGSNGIGNFRLFRRWLHAYKVDYGDKGDPIPYELGIDMSWDGKTPNTFGSNRWQANDDQRIYETTYLKIKNITLAYNLPQRLVEKVSIKGAKVYCSVDNLVNWNHYPGPNPEGSYQTSGTTYGVDYTAYPVSRKFVFGLNVNF